MNLFVHMHNIFYIVLYRDVLVKMYVGKHVCLLFIVILVDMQRMEEWRRAFFDML